MDVWRKLPGAESTNKSVVMHCVTAAEHSFPPTNMIDSEATKHMHVDPSGEDFHYKCVASADVERTPVGQEKSKVTPVQKSS